jgi:hypothetical protein
MFRNSTSTNDLEPEKNQLTKGNLMTTNTATLPTASIDFAESLRSKGYYMREVMLLTLITGIYLHVTTLFIGVPRMTRYIVTPTFDMLFAIPITYAAIMLWVNWRRVEHPALWHKLAYSAIAMYFTVSIPFHVRTYMVGNTDVLLKFPTWYSAALLPFLFALLAFAWNLRFKTSD